MMEMDAGAVTPDNRSKAAVTWIDFMIVLAKRKSLVIGLPLAALALSALAAFLLPPVYKAGATLLPPQQGQSGAAALLSQFGGAAGALGGMAGIKNPADVYVGMLKSRTVADKLVSRFDLVRNYKVNSVEAARRELEKNTIVNAGKDGMISIDVEGGDRMVVAAMANAYVAELTLLTKTLAVTEASQRRLFFEQQLGRAKDNLANAEIALKGALDTRGVISVDAESRTLLETVSRVRAQVTAKEIQLDSMRAFVTPQNQEFRRANEELGSLKSQLSRLENGSGASTTTEVRKGGMDNIKLLRDLKYYQMLYETLARQFELARLEEARDSSVIQVLDSAIAPERPIRPRRLLVVLIATAIATFVAIALAFILEAAVPAWRGRAQNASWRAFQASLRRGKRA